MAQLKDTTIAGNLNVSGAIQIGDTDVMDTINELKVTTTIVNETVNYTPTAVNTYEYTGLSISVPAGCEYNLRCYISYTNNSPNGIVVNYGTSTSLQNYRIVNRNDNGAGVCICGYTDYDIIFYVWGSWSGKGQNKASVIGTIRPV